MNQFDKIVKARLRGDKPEPKKWYQQINWEYLVGIIIGTMIGLSMNYLCQK